MKTPRPVRLTAFTLIELLVVISIIAILAGLSLSSIGAVQTTAKKVQAKNDMVQLSTAIKSYYVDYGRYPIPSDQAATAADIAFGTSARSNNILVNILRAQDGTGNASHVNNPRQVRYLELAKAKDQSYPKSGIVGDPSSGGQWVDPWGYEYLAFIDGDYSGDLDTTTTVNLAFTGSGFGADTNSKIQISVGTASGGLYYKSKGNGSTGAKKVTAHAFNKAFDLLSWQ